MKQGLHPVYRTVTVSCACGETFITGSTRQALKVEICSKCHPFFTGTQKLVDSARRVEKFKKKYGDITTAPPRRKKKAAQEEAPAEAQETAAGA